jgi:hypothetical protein
MRRRRTAAGLAILALATAGLLGTVVSGSGSSGRAFASERYSFEGRLPLGWQRSNARLVPLLMPREVLSVGTFPMPVGGGGNCGREPVAAIRRMRPGDALVSIQEYVVTAALRRRLTRNFPPKSLQLGLRGLRLDRVASTTAGRGVSVTRATIPFSEAGRAFDALVYFGGRPSADMRDAAARVLADLDFERRAWTI